jgi:hypothetical protein
MNRIQLDQQRADMLEALYERSGRDDLPYGHPLRCTYTGLWEEFVLGNVVRAIDATESVMTQKQAQQAIEVCRQQLLGRWR